MHDAGTRRKWHVVAVAPPELVVPVAAAARYSRRVDVRSEGTAVIGGFFEWDDLVANDPSETSALALARAANTGKCQLKRW
jgi:hypothetical protein